MPSGRWSDSEIRCALLWRLARRLGWGQWVPENDLVKAVPSHEQGRARSIAGDLGREPYMNRGSRGYRIADIDAVGHELRDCGYSEFRIETTLSHFEGFD